MASLRPRLTSLRIALLALAAVLMVSGCRSSAESRSVSKQELKSGLLALDRGDENGAETHLQAALSADPKNSRARTALASIYARRAGIFLRNWLDPLTEAGQQIGTRLKSYSQAYETISKLGAQDDEDAPAKAPELGRQDDQRAEEIKRRILQVHNNLGRVAIGAVVAIDVFRNVPYLANPDMEQNLIRAIELLRDEDPRPEARSEEVRVYLSVLSLVRFIIYTRDFVGSFDHEAKKIFTQNSRFCLIDASEIREKVFNIRDSLATLEEGLRTSDVEAASSKQRKARQKLHRFVKKILIGNGDWDNLDHFFSIGSDENLAAMKIFRHFCGVKGTKFSEIKRGKEAETGATLFDPDAE